jgi:predicted  nucleic acid-binding Zn-ribbon protein
LISVTCGQCGETYEIGEEFAGVTEFCPNCGALNDIPDPERPEGDADSAIPTSPPELDAPWAVKRGVPAGLWWGILISALGIFAIACVYLFSDTWESRNIQALSDATNRGDVLMTDEDYAGAAQQYGYVIDSVSGRTIESVYIRALVDRARRGEIDAQRRLRAAPATAPAAQTTAAASTMPADVAHHLAIQSFQRDFEAFAAFVRGHPVIFEDSGGNWRRRRYVVWNATYDPPDESGALRIMLRFDCGSRVTQLHSNRADAAADDDFIFDESPRAVHCGTQFEWLEGRWLIASRDSQVDPNELPGVDVRASLDDFYDLEKRAFHANGARR